ncbi:hypothetical protein L1987_47134 [Smallanthus sonchifolius]|uniref:Uncharacterized protein n=1 Tax=Smallanthus sonchifolius TaxID=185202 RepID=A0ACB9G1Q7_9ASTR|nr:hypothetical protein L1987_47134 [Smallanthus sonchifolius]
MYSERVRAGAVGLLLNSVVAGVVSLGIEQLGRVLVTKVAEDSRHFVTGDDGVTTILPPSGGVKGCAFAVFCCLSIGILNLAVVLPLMFMSVVSRPWDALFGGGNLPAFVAGEFASAISGILAFTMLPSPPPDVVLAKVSRAAMH